MVTPKPDPSRVVLIEIDILVEPEDGHGADVIDIRTRERIDGRKEGHLLVMIDASELSGENVLEVVRQIFKKLFLVPVFFDGKEGEGKDEGNSEITVPLIPFNRIVFSRVWRIINTK